MSNHHRVLIKFLSLWSRYERRGQSTPFPTVEVDRNNMYFTYGSLPKRSSDGGCGGGGGCGAGGGRDWRGGGASALKTAGAQPTSLRSCSRTKSSTKRIGKKTPSPAFCATTTAKLDEALGAFTKLFVLCRRCRRPCTALYASNDAAGNGVARNSDGTARAARSGGVHNSGGGKGFVTSTASSFSPAASTGYRGRGVTLWVECQGDGCGLTSGVGIGVACGGNGGTGPPEWLVRFSRYVLNRSWKVRLCRGSVVDGLEPVLCVFVVSFPVSSRYTVWRHAVISRFWWRASCKSHRPKISGPLA